MIRRPAVVPLLVCALAVAGCSALAGRDVHVSPVDPASTPRTPTAASTSAERAGGARLDQADVVDTVLAAAKKDFETIYTFDYRNLPKYRAAGLAVTTAPYADRYSGGLRGPMAKQLKAAQQVQVPTADHAAIVELAGSRALVLVNGTVVTSSTGTTAPVSKPTTVALTLKRIGRAWKVSDLSEGGKRLGRLPANRDLMDAIAVSRTCIDHIFGLTRAHFDADFARVLGCTTGDLHARLQTSRSTQRTTLTDGGYDLDSKIVGLGVARADGTSAELLVVLDEYRLAREGSKSGPYPLVFDLIVLRANGRWLLSSATQVS